MEKYGQHWAHLQTCTLFDAETGFEEIIVQDGCSTDEILYQLQGGQIGKSHMSLILVCRLRYSGVIIFRSHWTSFGNYWNQTFQSTKQFCPKFHLECQMYIRRVWWRERHLLQAWWCLHRSIRWHEGSRTKTKIRWWRWTDFIHGRSNSRTSLCIGKRAHIYLRWRWRELLDCWSLRGT